MINPVSTSTLPATAIPIAPSAKPQQTSAAAPKDTVQLSSKAQAQAAGDVDHDGDSH